jgi:hypothetical protein
MLYKLSSAIYKSLREKVKRRGIKSNTFVDDFDPLTPTSPLYGLR